MHRSLSSKFIVGVLSLAVCTGARADWRLWESPTANTEVVDQSQTATNTFRILYAPHGLGQSFVHQGDMLYRIDFTMHNRLDLSPFRIRLYAWADLDADGKSDEDEYEATVAAAPLWEDQGSLPGPAIRRVVSVYPRVEVTPGALLYVEFTSDTLDGEWAFYAVRDSTDRYPPGGLRTANRFLDEPAENIYEDLYLVTFDEPQGAPEPLTCASTQLEAPCYSVEQPWSPPATEGPIFNGPDYLEIMRTAADAYRPGLLSGSGSSAHQNSVLDACLYEIGNDEGDAANAAALLNKAYDWRAAHRTNGVSFSWTESPGWAYEWIRDSSTLSPEDHVRIKTLLLHSIMRYFPYRELGMHNHSLAGALSCKLVTELVPVEEFADLSRCLPGPAPDCSEGLFDDGEQLTAADHAEWTAFADAMWQEFVTNLDVLEDASMYDHLDLRYLLQLARLYGEEDAIWTWPGFRSLVDRLFDYHTPLGPYAAWGDMNGWNQTWATPAWLWERAAAATGEARYRWLASRVMEYTARAIDSHEAWQAIYLEHPALCHAYLAHDPSIEPRPPPAQAEVTAAAHDEATDANWAFAAEGIGQRFRATADRLARIDLRLHGSGSDLPAEVRLWSWAGDLASTVSGPVLFGESFPVTATGGYHDYSVYPFLEVDPNAEYFLEIRRDDPLIVRGTGPGGPDGYAEGELWHEGAAVADADLWFRTWTLSGGGSVVTHRRKQLHLKVSEMGSPPRLGQFGVGEVPDKLVLRSGYETDGLHAVFNLTAGNYTHGQLETGALVSLVDDRSVLYVDGSYGDRLEKDQNNLFARRYWGGPPQAMGVELDVTRFADSRGATVAWLDWQDPFGWALDHQRRIYFVKDRLIWIRDRTNFHGAITASTGSVWHSQDVRSTSENNSHDLYYRAPRAVSNRVYKNPEHYALLYMVDRPGYEFAEWEVDNTGNPPSGRYVMTQRWLGDAVDGTELWFDSLLLPHGPEISPESAAAAVEVRFDDGTAVALEVTIGDEVWTLLDNPDGGTLALPDLATDARYLICRTRPGHSPYLLTFDASHVHVSHGPDRTVDATWFDRTSVEIGDAVSSSTEPARPGPSSTQRRPDRLQPIDLSR